MRTSTQATCVIAVSAFLVFSEIGCSEQTKFTPLDPAGVANRITQTLDTMQFKQSQGIGAGRAGELMGFTVYEGEHPSIVFLMDWLSVSNNITVAVHRRGRAGALDFSGIVTPDNCSVPAMLVLSSSLGTPIGTTLPQPLCPIVASNVTTTKPKALEISGIAEGNYSVVITNPGSAETVRYAFLEN